MISLDRTCRHSDQRFEKVEKLQVTVGRQEVQVFAGDGEKCKSVALKMLHATVREACLSHKLCSKETAVKAGLAFCQLERLHVE